MLIVLSLVLHVTSVSYCVLKRLRRARAEKGLRACAEDTESLETQRSLTELEPDMRLETECLLGDIACFPDGSLRYIHIFSKHKGRFDSKLTRHDKLCGLFKVYYVFALSAWY